MPYEPSIALSEKQKALSEYSESYGQPISTTGKYTREQAEMNKAEIGKRIGSAITEFAKSQAPMFYPSEMERISALPTQERRNLAARDALALTQISPVYHGSPYKFEKFKNEAIGTGEGAQAFGYGHYFTEDPKIAEHYKKALGNLKSPTSNVGLRSESFERNGVSYSRWYNEFYRWDEKQAKMVNIKDKEFWAAKDQPTGYKYEAALHEGKQPGEYEYLRWDVPLIEQKNILDRVRAAFKNIRLTDEQIESMLNRGITGQQAYTYLASSQGEKVASQLLKVKGIDGIKYPTGTLSGVKGSDKFNYVVFDPTDITIKGIK